MGSADQPVRAGRIYRLRLALKSTIQGFPLRLELHLPNEPGYADPYLWQKDVNVKNEWQTLETYLQVPLRDGDPESRDAVLRPTFRLRVVLDPKDLETKYRAAEPVLWLDEIELRVYNPAPNQ